MSDRGNAADSSVALSIGQCATLACLLEAAIPKPGNVHRGADFHDLTFYDFAAAAVAVGPVFERARQSDGVGRTVLDAVGATRRLTGTNVNLGIVLLLAPLARVKRAVPLPTGVAGVLQALTPEDAARTYEAIRLAEPGGLGTSDEADLAGPAPVDLLAAMRLAADRDLVARQYVDDFAEVFEVVGDIVAQRSAGRRLADAVIRAHLRLMHEHPDALIARKCGAAVAREAAAYAGQVLAAGEPGEETYHEALADFDFWLRSDGHRRNPGTTADLIAAALFVLLRDNMISDPLRV